MIDVLRAMTDRRSTRLPFFVHRCVRRAGNVLRQAGVRDEAVLLGVSGGGDSMALLEIVALLAPGLGLSLHVSCVDHGLRAEAGAESSLVRDAAVGHGASFHPVRVEVGAADEDSLRRARHRALEQIAASAGCRVILLGHSSDDQVETILFRFLRGAGLGGLAGMREVRPPFVRPLLSIGRDELRRVLRARGVAWAEDATNLSARYARGRLRSVVLPAIDAAFGAGAARHLLDVAPRWRADEDFLEIEAGRLLAYASRRGPSGTELDLDALVSAHAAPRARALRRWLEDRTGQAMTSRSLANVERWVDGDRSAAAGSLDLAGATLVRRGGRLVVVAPAIGAATIGGRGIDIPPSSDDACRAASDIRDDSDPGGAEAVLPPSDGRVRFPRN